MTEQIKNEQLELIRFLFKKYKTQGGNYTSLCIAVWASAKLLNVKLPDNCEVMICVDREMRMIADCVDDNGNFARIPILKVKLPQNELEITQKISDNFAPLSVLLYLRDNFSKSLSYTDSIIVKEAKIKYGNFKQL